MLSFEALALELKTLRYLINNIIVATKQQNDMLALLLAKNDIKIEKPKKKTDEKKSVPEDAVRFDLFVLTPAQYNALVKEYGYDVVTRSCAMLDDFVRTEGYMPYGKPVLALKKAMVIHALKEKLDNSKVKITSYKDINPDLITTKPDAIAFIRSVPKHIRNINPDVRKLAEKFDIKEEDD